MSYIPNKAMPHAAPAEDEDDFEETGFYEWDGEEDEQSILERMSELARDNPKTALGAGVALIAGAIAGLAWPFVKSKSSAPKTQAAGCQAQGTRAQVRHCRDRQNQAHHNDANAKIGNGRNGYAQEEQRFQYCH